MSNSTSKPVFVNTEMTTAVRDAVNKVEGAKRAMSKFADTAIAESSSTSLLHTTIHFQKLPAILGTETGMLSTYYAVSYSKPTKS